MAEDITTPTPDGDATETETPELTIQEQVIPILRRAHRIMSTRLYDDELILHVNTVLQDLNTLHINTEKLTPNISMACVFYSKSTFGIGGTDDKGAWKIMYEDLKRQMLLRGE